MRTDKKSDPTTDIADLACDSMLIFRFEMFERHWGM